MSAIENLLAIARGDTPPDDGLLGNARCGWGRTELIGEESILAAFCAEPFATDSDLLAIECAQSAVLIGRQDALFADIYDGRIGRLWRVRVGMTFADEHAIDVAFDPDMRQLRGDVYFRAADHPMLDDAGAEQLLTAARMHVNQVRRAGALRARAFVIRAFGGAGRGAALLSIYAMTNGTNRSVSFSYAILGFGSDEAALRAVGEQTPPRAWTPRF